MREIKFRAWAYQSKKMYYDIMLGGKPNTKITGTVPICWNEERGDWVNLWGSNLHDGVVMQFTGLKDKNGKEIYEGDIVKRYCNHSVEYQDILSVVYEENDAAFLFSGRGFVGDEDFWPLEVLGNIYENPELLK